MNPKVFSIRCNRYMGVTPSILLTRWQNHRRRVQVQVAPFVQINCPTRALGAEWCPCYSTGCHTRQLRHYRRRRQHARTPGRYPGLASGHLAHPARRHPQPGRGQPDQPRRPGAERAPRLHRLLGLGQRSQRRAALPHQLLVRSRRDIVAVHGRPVRWRLDREPAVRDLVGPHGGTLAPN